MINVKIDAELLANGKFQKQVVEIINDVVKQIKQHESALQDPKAKLKSTPVLRLYRAGQLTKEYFMAEFENIVNRTSKQPSAIRDVISNTIVVAAQRTIILDQQQRAIKAAEKANAKAAVEANNEQGKNDELRGTMEAGTGAAEGD